MRRSILTCGLLLAFAGMATAAAGAVGPSSTRENSGTTTATTAAPVTTSPVAIDTRARARTMARWNRHIRGFRAATRHWLTVIHGRPPGVGSPRLLAAVHSMDRLHELAIAWQHREHAAWWRANHPPALRAWLCIHHYEGSWTDSGGPYWGGLQMDLGFQETYGGWLLRHKGTADHWSPLEQIWVAVRAWRVRGYAPWPNTARYCGLS